MADVPLAFIVLRAVDVDIFGQTVRVSAIVLQGTDSEVVDIRPIAENTHRKQPRHLQATRARPLQDIGLNGSTG